MGHANSKQLNQAGSDILQAIREGDELTFLQLLRGDARLALWVSTEGNSALHLSAGLGRHDLVKFVVDAAARYTTLTLSPKAAKLAMSRLLNAKTDYGQTALMLACKRGHVGVVRALLAEGADPLATDYMFRTCLHYAALCNWGPVIDELLGGQHLWRPESPWVPAGPRPLEPVFLKDASVHDISGTSRFIDAQAELGFGAIHMACSQGHLHAVKALLKAGASLHTQTHGAQHGNMMSKATPSWRPSSSPLHIAAAHGSLRLARLLLSGYAERVAAAIQEHQDTGDPLILPNDIRLLQDHNGQKPHDVAAAFYEEVPEVWEHLKLMLDPDIPLGQLAASISGPQGPPTLAFLASAVLRTKLMEQLTELRAEGANPVLLSLRPAKRSSSKNILSQSFSALQRRRSSTLASAASGAASGDVSDAATPRGSSSNLMAQAMGQASGSPASSVQTAGSSGPAQAAPPLPQAGHASSANSSQRTSRPPSPPNAAAAGAAAAAASGTATDAGSGFSPPVRSPFAEAADSQQELREAVFSVRSTLSQDGGSRAAREHAHEMRMRRQASPHIQVSGVHDSSQSSEDPENDQICIDHLPSGSLPSNLDWRLQPSPDQAASSLQPAHAMVDGNSESLPAGTTASSSPMPAVGRPRRHSVSAPNSPLKSPKPWLRKQFAKLSRSSSQSRVAGETSRQQDMPQPSTSLSLSQSMSSPSLAAPLQRLPETAAAAAASDGHPGPSDPTHAGRSDGSQEGHSMGEEHSEGASADRSASAEGDMSSVATDTDASSLSLRTSGRLQQGGHRWEWESYRVAAPKRPRSGRSRATNQPSRSAPASPRFETIQPFLDNTEHFADEAPAEAAEAAEPQQSGSEQAAGLQQPVQGEGDLHGQRGPEVGSGSDGSPAWTARAMATALSQSIVGQDCRYLQGPAECEICYSSPKLVAIDGCGHDMCGECASELCRKGNAAPPTCPFCRHMIGGFHMVNIS